MFSRMNGDSRSSSLGSTRKRWMNDGYACPTACRLVDLIARSGRTLSEMVSDFPVYVSTPELRIEVTEETKFAIVEAAQDHFSETREVIDVDGARVRFDGGWGLPSSGRPTPRKPESRRPTSIPRN